MTTIKLPCSARALEETIRSFCEQHGCYDRAIVKAGVCQSKDSFGETVVLKIMAEGAKK